MSVGAHQNKHQADKASFLLHTVPQLGGEFYRLSSVFGGESTPTLLELANMKRPKHGSGACLKV